MTTFQDALEPLFIGKGVATLSEPTQKQRAIEAGRTMTTERITLGLSAAGVYAPEPEQDIIPGRNYTIDGRTLRMLLHDIAVEHDILVRLVNGERIPFARDRSPELEHPDCYASINWDDAPEGHLQRTD